MSQITINNAGVIPPAGFVETLTGNSGGPVAPTGGNINVVGDGTTLTIAGNPGTSTLTATVAPVFAATYTTDDANFAVPAAYNLNIFGAGGVTTTSAGSTVTIHGAAPTTFTGNVGGPESPVAGNFNIITFGTNVLFHGSAGTQTLDFNQSNILLGSNGAITVGTDNTGLGLLALANINSGNDNTAIGFEAMEHATTSNNCTAVGSFALFNGTTTAHNNTAVGFEALSTITTGAFNTALGQQAGISLTTTDSSNICLANAGTPGDNNIMRLGTTGAGNGQVNKCFLAGVDGVNVGSVAKVLTMASEQVGTATITAGTGISITPGANTITIAASSAVAESFPTDSGTATPSSGVLNIDGDSHNITTSGSGNTVNVKLTGITQHSLQVGGASNALTQLGVATNGQLPIGSTGADPVLATLTAGTGISISNGAGSITISATGTTNLTYTNVNTTPYVVLTTDEYLSVDASGSAITVQLPNAATSGRAYVIKDRTGSAATRNITVTTVGGAVNIDGATSFVMNTNFEAINVIGNGSSYEVF